jgi:sterol 3beta-glucosyltransferase
MRILLIGMGSRGDVQPILALAHGLKDAGYDVTIGAGLNFQQWIEDEGFTFAPFQIDIQQMMNSDSGKEWIEKSSDSSMREAQNMKRMMDEYGMSLSDDLLAMCEKADVLVSGLPTFGMVESIAEKLGKKHITIMLAPIVPTPIADSTMVPMLPRRKSFLNRISGYIGEYFVWWIFKDAVNQFRAKLGLKPFTYREYIRRWNNMPLIYGTSPILLPRDPNWHNEIFVTGYWYLLQGENWQAPKALCDFLEAGAKPVYIGFGSMSNQNPEATTKLMTDALKQSGQRGIIYTGWAGLKATDLPDDIFLLDGAPHDWLFPRMKAIVHHGGAGTTAAGIRSGVPATVVSHMADQPYWGRRLHELGVGAPLIRRHELTTERLARAIRQMATDNTMQQTATELGERIRQEQGVKNAVAAFNTILRSK